MGLFGTAATLLIDFNLILQYIVLILLVVGYVKRKPLKNHGYLMMTVLLISVGTTLLIMAPRFLDTYTTYGPMVLAHMIGGIITMLLTAVFTFRFIRALRNENPLACGTKYWMWLAFILWLIPIFGGTMLYFTLYV